VLLTSPLLRARQTADLLMDAFDDLKLKLDLKETAALAPPGNLPALLKQAEKQDALAVGHEPFLSDAIAQLCFHSAGNMEFKKGALAALEFEHARSAKLLFLLQPSQLRRLA
jgi:phosphohistidine phosphatase SixA